MYLYNKEGVTNNYVTFTTKFGSIYNSFVPIKETIEVTKEASQEMENTVVEDAVANVSTEEVDGELILDYEEELQYAKNFTLTHYKGGYKMFTIPEAMGDNQYLLVPEGKSVPAELSENTIVLQQPLTRVASGISAATSLIDAIGGLDNIVAVTTKYEEWMLMRLNIWVVIVNLILKCLWSWGYR